MGPVCLKELGYVAADRIHLAQYTVAACYERGIECYYVLNSKEFLEHTSDCQLPKGDARKSCGCRKLC
jgi:hypothetical protein